MENMEPAGVLKSSRPIIEHKSEYLAPLTGFFLLAIGMPLWIYWSTSTPVGDPLPSWPLIVILQLAAIRLVWILSRPERRLHEMIFWMFVYIFFGLAPIVQVRLGIEPSTTPNLNALFYGQAVLIIMIGCFAWMLGNSWATRNPPRNTTGLVRPVVKSRAQGLFLASFGVAIYYTFSIGPEVLFESREARSIAVSDRWPESAVAELLNVGTSMALLVAYVAQRQALVQSNIRGVGLARALLIANGVVLFILVNPVSSSRYLFGTVLLAFLASHGTFSTRRAFRILTLIAVPAFVQLFPLADYFRAAATEEGVTFDVTASMLSGDYDSFAQTINAAEYVNERGVTWGDQFMGALFLWVPRSLWVGKPQPTGSLIADFKEYGFHNLSTPIWAEFFIDGAWLFLIVGMCLLGIILGRLDQNAEIALGKQKIAGIIGCILPFFMIILLRGTLMGVASALLVLLMTTLIVTERQSWRPRPSAAYSGDGWNPAL